MSEIEVNRNPMSGIMTLTPTTKRAMRWLKKHCVIEDWQWQGGDIVVDARCGYEIYGAYVDAMNDVYCTSFCNSGHRTYDGKPVEHECVVLPPKALHAEKEGNYKAAQMLIDASRKKPHKGTRLRKTGT